MLQIFFEATTTGPLSTLPIFVYPHSLVDTPSGLEATELNLDGEAKPGAEPTSSLACAPLVFGL